MFDCGKVEIQSETERCTVLNYVLISTLTLVDQHFNTNLLDKNDEQPYMRHKLHDFRPLYSCSGGCFWIVAMILLFSKAYSA